MPTAQRRVIVIGAGAAGLMAAAEAATHGADVLLLEKSNKTGVKILMSGGTRCNLTQDTDARGITDEFGHAKRFLQPSVGKFPPSALVDHFHRHGLSTKVESTGKVFPTTDRALHVRDLLLKLARKSGVEIRCGCAVTGIDKSNGLWRVTSSGESIEAARVIVTVGGRSYPGCGTTGDGYQWLQKLGHTIVPPRPALVPLVGGNDWTHELSGVTLEDVVVTVKRPKTKSSLALRRGSLLFTHFGFSGPAAMDVSGSITATSSCQDLRVTADLLPDVSEDYIRTVLTNREQGRRKVAKIVADWLPNRLADAIATHTNSDHALAELPRAGSVRLIEHLKRLAMPIRGTRGFAKAEVTAGGVSLKEVDPNTMQSRIHRGLFIAGEVLDVDGPIGGYNFQAAFSTGRAAGIAAAEQQLQSSFTEYDSA